MFARHRHARLLGTSTSRRWTGTLAGSLLVTSCLALSVTVPTAAHADTRTQPARTPSGGHSTTTALAEARRTGHGVGIPSLTTPTETVTANPSGSLTLTQSAFPTRVKRGGGWVPVDTTLHAGPDGRLQPAAVPSPITLSGGGRTPLATMTSTGRRLSLTWPDALPKPVISGATATYPEVLPGVDLKVTVSPLGGFSDVLVVKNKTAAADPSLSSLALTVSSPGLTMTSRPNGSVLVSDRTGAGVFTAPTAVMWDSSSKAAAGKASAGPSGPAAAPATSSADGPGRGAALATVRATAGHGHLTLTPDSRLLRGSATHYPVYIDPDFQPVPASDPITGYDEVQQGCPTKNAYKSATAPYDTPGVGLNDYSGCIGIERALYQFKVDPHLWDANVAVIDATFKAKEVYSASCSVTSNVSLSLISGVGTGTTWNTQPSPGTVQDTKSFGSACSSNPSQGYDVMDAFTKAHNHKWQGVAFMMRATDEGNDLDFRRFSNNPTVTVEYNTKPSVASATTSPDSSRIGNTSVILDAYVTDADRGAPVQAKFTIVGKNSAGTVVYAKKSLEPAAQVTQAGDISWRVGYLPSGTYTWTAQADDGDTQHPAAVVTKTFTVDSTAPAPPDITSPQIPDDPNSTSVPPARTQMEFHFSPSAGTATDTAYYAYNWGTEPPSVNPPNTVPPDAGSQSATLYATPMGFVYDKLCVYAVDTAGNQSATRCRSFRTAPPTGKDVSGDLTGDGTPDLLTPGADGNLRLYAGTGDGHLSAPVNLWKKSESDTTDFTGAKVAVGAFGGNVEQDVLVLRSGGQQADIYAGNGDGEPLPWTTTSQDATTSVTLKQTALLESEPDPTTGEEPTTPTLPWSSVAQIAADDSPSADGGVPNLWLVTTDGKLYWATGTTAFGVFNPPVDINDNFQGMTIASAGVVAGHPALWARNASTGKLFLYTATATTPAGAAGGAAAIDVGSPAGWASTAVNTIFPAGGTGTASGVPALWATDAQALHNVYSYPANTSAGATSLPTRVRVQTLDPSDDFTGDGQADIVAEWGDGTLHMYTGESGGKLTSGRQIWDSTWSSMKLMASGDFNGDGKADVMAVWGDGTLHLYPGTGTGGLDDPSSPIPDTKNTWSTVRQLASGDFNGDGRTDLAAVWGDGTLHLYAGDGQGGLLPSTDMWKAGDTTWSTTKIVTAGDYNGDGDADLLAIWKDGTLHLYPGDGTGKVTSGPQMPGGTTWSTVRHLIPGDFSGDGKTDLAAVWGDGTLHLYRGDGQGNLGSSTSMWPDTSWIAVKLTA